MTRKDNTLPMPGESVYWYLVRLKNCDYSERHLKYCRQLLNEHFHGMTFEIPVGERSIAILQQCCWLEDNAIDRFDMLIGNGTTVAFTYAEDAVKFRLSFDYAN